MYPTHIKLELQMEARVQVCFSAEAEQADGPAAKRARTAGGANVGGVALAHRMWARPASIPATRRSRQLVELQRSGIAAMRAAARLWSWERWESNLRLSEVESLQPLSRSARWLHSCSAVMPMARRTRLLHSARSLWMARTEG